MGKRLRRTPATLAILEVLLEAEELHGLEVCERTGLPSGTVYPVLARLEVHGLATSRWEELSDDAQRPARRFYRLSGEGRPFARTALAEGNPIARRPNPPEVPDGVYMHKNRLGVAYYLHSKKVVMRDGKSQTIYFFAREVRADDACSRLPDGFAVVENERTGLIVLKKRTATID